MPLYSWECECKALTEVKRSMEEIDNPPESCETCGKQSFIQRVIPKLHQYEKPIKGFMLVDGGVGWPSHGFYNKNPKDWRNR